MLLIPMTKALTPTKLQNAKQQHKGATKNFNYTTFSGRFKMSVGGTTATQPV